MFNPRLAFLLAFAVNLGSSTPLELLDTNASCGDPFVSVGGHCLHFSTEAGTWDEMRSYCQNLGGDMVKIDDANLIYDIEEHVETQGIPESYFYIGGSDRDHAGEWRWTDGSNVKMGSPFWGFNCSPDEFTREPTNLDNEDCMYISKGGYFLFHDCYCTEKYSVICEQ
ncbi:C-type lectin domain family 17, member A-like [Palaemon carinicauda]|uniref:C-type lectin domain family 17, member A-like n=1 Tax=Palaemon carinicauda TaxID=392227 RepID=UPI0035B61BB8